jgi:hypothetical protein
MSHVGDAQTGDGLPREDRGNKKNHPREAVSRGWCADRATPGYGVLIERLEAMIWPSR